MSVGHEPLHGAGFQQPVDLASDSPASCASSRRIAQLSRRGRRARRPGRPARRSTGWRTVPQVQRDPRSCRAPGTLSRVASSELPPMLKKLSCWLTCSGGRSSSCRQISAMLLGVRSPAPTCSVDRSARRGQLAPIQLAAGVQRQRVERGEGGRQHVLRQPAQPAAPAGRPVRPCRPARAPGRQPAAVRRQPGAPPPPTGASRKGLIACSISPSSIRRPRILTCRSARPRNSSWPSARQRTTSPVRYIRSPGSPNGQGRNRSAVKPGRPDSRGPVRRRPRTARQAPRSGQPAGRIQDVARRLAIARPIGGDVLSGSAGQA